MLTIEELEHRVTRLETLFEDVIKERLTYISQRLDQLYQRFDQLYQRFDQLYEKTERDKTEFLVKTERDKTELLEKIASLYTKTERDKRELIYWMAGLMVGFATLTITAIWAILSFALK